MNKQMMIEALRKLPRNFPTFMSDETKRTIGETLGDVYFSWPKPDATIGFIRARMPGSDGSWIRKVYYGAVDIPQMKV